MLPFLLSAAVTVAVSCDPGPLGHSAELELQLELSDAVHLGTAGHPVPDSLVVHVTDGRGRRVEGAAVAFAAGPGSGFVSPSGATTDANGMARTLWTMGTTAGEQEVHVALVRAHGDFVPSASVTESGDEENPAGRIRGWAKPGSAEVIEVTPRDAVAERGGQIQFSAEVRDKHGNVLPDSEISWRSLSPDVATVSSSGLAEALAAGSAVIEAGAEGGKLKDSATLTVPEEPAPPPSGDGRPGTVEDLRTTGSTETSIGLAFTEVDDGTGAPAHYRVRYAHASPSPSWPNDYIMVDEGACGNPVEGTAIGATFTCEVPGLEPATGYVFGLVAYRYGEDGERIFGEPSNEAAGATEEAEAPQPSDDGIWMSRADLMERPTSGSAWERLLTDAARDPGAASIADQDSNHDVYTLAAALVCVRAGEYCAKARTGVVDAIGTEQGGRWLAVGRNLGAYVIAADLLDLRADGDPASAGSLVEEWIEGWLTRRLRDNNTTELRAFGPFHSGANAAAQEGFAYAAVAAYLRDDRALTRAWEAYRTFTCDPAALDLEIIDLVRVVLDGWAHDDLNPCAINPRGTVKLVPLGSPGAGGIHRIDGSLGADMRRGGTYQWQPGYTSYPWVGLEGLVPAAVILQRAGFPAFDVADRAVLRTHEYLWFLRRETGDERWFDGIRAREIVHLVNAVYGSSFPVNRTIGGGRTVGYTEWTHPDA